MIFNGSVPEERLERSQRAYYAFCVLNGLAYMCVGEGVVVLFAVMCGFPDFVVSIVGAMLYLGYLLLPLGRTACARVGAVRSQAFFWVARNLAALLTAAGGIAAWCGFHSCGLAALVSGTFLFYGFRAAGVVMSQPLLGCITGPNERGRVLGISNGIFCGACMLSLLLVSLFLSRKSSVWSLAGVMAAGSCLGMGASRFLRRIDESAELRESAKRPLRAELCQALRSSALWKLVFAVFSLNTARIMIAPISILVVKRAYGISDTNALLFTLIQFLAGMCASFVSARIDNAIGPGRGMLAGYGLMLLAPVLWLCRGDVFQPAAVAAVFAVYGIGSFLAENANIHYFLQTFPKEEQVRSSILLQIFASAGAGLAGMALSGTLIHWTMKINPSEPMAGFHAYFALSLVMLSAASLLICRLVPLPPDKRRRREP